MTKEVRIYSGEKDRLKLDRHMQKNDTGTLSWTLQKNQLNTDPRLEAIILLKDRICSLLFDKGLGNALLVLAMLCWSNAK